MRKKQKREPILIIAPSKNRYRAIKLILAIAGIKTCGYKTEINEDTQIAVVYMDGNEYNHLAINHPNVFFISVTPKTNEYFDTEYQITIPFQADQLVETTMRVIHIVDKINYSPEPFIKVGSWRYYIHAQILKRGLGKSMTTWKINKYHRILLDTLLLHPNGINIHQLRNIVFAVRPLAEIMPTINALNRYIKRCPQCVIAINNETVSLITDWYTIRNKIAFQRYSNSNAAKQALEWLGNQAITPENYQHIKVNQEKYTRINPPKTPYPNMPKQSH